MERIVLRKSVVRSLSKYVALFFALIIALNGAVLYFVDRTYRSEIISVHESQLTQALDQVAEQFVEAQSILYSVRHLESLNRLLEKSRMPNAERVNLLRYEIISYFDSLLVWTHYVKHVRLIHASENLPNLYDSFVYSGEIAENGFPVFLSGLFRARNLDLYVEHLPSDISYFPTIDSGDGRYTINLYLPIYSKSTLDIAGLGQVSVDADRLFSAVLGEEAPAFLIDPMGGLIWSNGLMSDAECLDSVRDLSSDGLNRWFGSTALVSEYTSLLNMTIYKQIDFGFVVGYRSIVLLTALMVISLLALLILLTVRVYRPFRRQMAALIGGMERVRERGDYESRIPVSGENELSVLSDTFNHMIGNTRELMENIILSGKAEKQAVYAALSNQIRPHFLNNALDKLRMQARAHDEIDIAHTLERIMRYLSFNLGKQDTSVTLSEELENVADYIGIYKMSRGEEIELSINAQGNARGQLLKYKLPKFTLLPIVENCIHHGFAGNQPVCRILITIGLSENQVDIQVEDNGGGIEPIRLIRLKGHLERRESEAIESTGSGIGLSMIRQRLELYYNREIPFQIESYEGTGTLVSFCVPAVNGEDK